MVKSTFFTALTAIMVLLISGLNVSVWDRLLQQEPDFFVKLSDVKGDYRSEPAPYIKVGDIQAESA